MAEHRPQNNDAIKLASIAALTQVVRLVDELLERGHKSVAAAEQLIEIALVERKAELTGELEPVAKLVDELRHIDASVIALSREVSLRAYDLLEELRGDLLDEVTGARWPSWVA